MFALLHALHSHCICTLPLALFLTPLASLHVEHPALHVYMGILHLGPHLDHYCVSIGFHLALDPSDLISE